MLLVPCLRAAGAARRGLVLLALAALLAVAGGASAQTAAPVDEKLQAAYQRVRFERMFPPESVALIQERLQHEARALTGLNELARHETANVRMLTAVLLGEYGDSDGSETLWRLIQDDQEFVRVNAAGALLRLKRLTPVHVSTEGLLDKRPEVRRLTAATLGGIADKAAEAALIDVLDDEDELVRAEVVVALSKNSCGTDIATPSLVERLKDPSVVVRDRTATVLGGAKDVAAVDGLLAALKDPDWHVRAAAANSLAGQVNESPEVVAALVTVLQTDEFALVRDRAAGSLGFAKDNEKAVDALVAAIVSGNRDARIHAANSLILGKQTEAVPKLKEHLNHESSDVRQTILRVLGALGGEDDVPAAQQASEDSDPLVRLSAVRALRSIYLRTAVKLDPLAGLDDPNPHVRAASARSTGDLGQKDAVPKLISMLRDDNGYVRGAAAEALGKLGDRTAVKPLLEVLSGDRPATGSPFEGLVIGTGEDALLEAAKRRVVKYKIQAVRALGDLGNSEAVDPLVEHGLRHEDPGLRAESAVSLGKIGDQRAVEPLQETVRPFYAAAATTRELEEGNIIAGALPENMRQMKEREARVRASVAWALGELADPATIPVLSQAANDENSLVRDAAIEALAKVQERVDAVVAKQSVPPPPATAPAPEPETAPTP